MDGTEIVSAEIFGWRLNLGVHVDAKKKNQPKKKKQL